MKEFITKHLGGKERVEFENEPKSKWIHRWIRQLVSLQREGDKQTNSVLITTSFSRNLWHCNSCFISLICLSLSLSLSLSPQSILSDICYYLVCVAMWRLSLCEGAEFEWYFILFFLPFERKHIKIHRKKWEGERWQSPDMTENNVGLQGNEHDAMEALYKSRSSIFA